MLMIVLYHLHYHYYSWIATEFKLGVMIMVHTISVHINFLFKIHTSFQCNIFGLYTSLLFMLMFYTSYCFCLHMYLHQLQVPSTYCSWT